MNWPAGRTGHVSMKVYHKGLVNTSRNLNARRMSAVNYVSVYITGRPIVVLLAQNGKRSHILGRNLNTSSRYCSKNVLYVTGPPNGLLICSQPVSTDHGTQTTSQNPQLLLSLKIPAVQSLMTCQLIT